jgi:hypothetical protein
LFPAVLILSNCTAPGENVVVTQTDYVKQSIPIQERPKPVEMPPLDWYVVSPKNQTEFYQKLEEDTGETTFMAISPKGYENLSIGIGELRRYMLQQQKILEYYEKSITGESGEPENEPTS